MVFFAFFGYRGKGGTKRQDSLPSPPQKTRNELWALLVRYVFETLIENRIFMRANNLCQKTDLLPPQKKVTLGLSWNIPHRPFPTFQRSTSHENWRLEPPTTDGLGSMFFLFQGIDFQVPAVNFQEKTYPHLYHLHMLFIKLSWRSLWILSDVDSNRASKLSTPSHPYESHSRIPWSMVMLWEAEIAKGSYHKDFLEKSLTIFHWIFLVAKKKEAGGVNPNMYSDFC